jgi:hypothetical protein
LKNLPEFLSKLLSDGQAKARAASAVKYLAIRLATKATV